MTSIHSIGFDIRGLELREQSKNHRTWLSEDAAAIRLQFLPGPPTWPFDLRDPDAAAFFYSNQCDDNNGLMLAMNVIRINGTEALHGLFKYRAPEPMTTGMSYVSILWLPFENCCYQINVESMELGTTGMREAVVMAMAPDAWPMPSQSEIPRIESQEQLAAMYAAARKRPPPDVPSDDPKYDAMFPDHPLTKVRARMSRILTTLNLDAVKRLSSFRLA